MVGLLPTINVGDFVGNLVEDIADGKKRFGGNANTYILLA